MKFVKRRPELLALEGWYDTGVYKFKLSCRFKDILRCSEFLDKPKHFTSCFRQGGLHEAEPRLRCLNPNWAVVYVPDKHGNFLGRAFIHYEEKYNEFAPGPLLVLDKIYGNTLKTEDILMKLIKIDCHASQRDTYLSRELP